jgi:hypothetical protein
MGAFDLQRALVEPVERIEEILTHAVGTARGLGKVGDRSGQYRPPSMPGQSSSGFKLAPGHVKVHHDVSLTTTPDSRQTILNKSDRPTTVGVELPARVQTCRLCVHP